MKLDLSSLIKAIASLEKSINSYQHICNSRQYALCATRHPMTGR